MGASDVAARRRAAALWAAPLSEALRCRDPARTRRRRPLGVCVLRNRIYLAGETIMIITLDVVLLILALVCFLASALNVSSPRVNLLATGLALWVASILF